VLPALVLTSFVFLAHALDRPHGSTSLHFAPEQESIVVLPLEVDGELPDKWREDAEARTRAAFERSSVPIVDGGIDESVGCRDRTCVRGLADKATHVARPRLSVSGERDYAFSIDLSSTRTGDVVATVSGECDLCGFEEVGALIEAKAVAAAAALEKLRAAVATVEIATTPPGASVEVDGTPQGTTPVDLELRAGVHRIRITKPGFREQSFEYEAIEGLRKRIDMPLVSAAPDTRPRDARRARGMLAAGGVLLGLGLAGVGGGAALLAIDGRPHERDCQADVEGNCRFLYGTKTGGIVAVAVGAAGAIAGVALVAVGARLKRKSQRPVALRFAPPAGLSISF
jgi:hypothetical protein